MTTLQALPLPSNFEDLCELFLLYIAYSTLGWCGEMLYCSIPKGHICEKRGFLNGFLCPIYGHGALLVLYLLHGGFQNPVLTFIFGAIVTSILEYFTSWIMEKLFHMRWWDYSHYKFQINGRVCLLNSTCFGLACVLLCHLVQPWLWEHIVNLGPTITVPLASFIFGIYLMDTVLSIRSAIQLSSQMASCASCNRSSRTMSPKSVRRARSARPSAVPRYASAPACCVTARISSSAACSTPTPTSASRVKTCSPRSAPA